MTDWVHDTVLPILPGKYISAQHFIFYCKMKRAYNLSIEGTFLRPSATFEPSSVLVLVSDISVKSAISLQYPTNSLF